MLCSLLGAYAFLDVWVLSRWLHTNLSIFSAINQKLLEPLLQHRCLDTTHDDHVNE